MAILFSLLTHWVATHLFAGLAGLLLPVLWRRVVRPALIWVIATALD